MKTNQEIIQIAKESLVNQSLAIENIASLLDENFYNTVKIILASEGRVVVTGIGKSALIGMKIVATFNSTGTPAMFMHAADAIHGDLGMIQPNDVILCISKSGNTPEIKALIPLLKNTQNTLIGITGDVSSYLGTYSDHVLNTYIEKEAGPNNLAPTTSTTAQLVMGDALAICLSNVRGFDSNDFAKYHPGGSLGKKLYLKVEHLIAQNKIPKVSIDTKAKDVIIEISNKMLGATVVMNNNAIVGIITDGDIRRMLTHEKDINLLTAQDIMSKNPKTIETDAMVTQAFELMEKHSISQLIVTQEGVYKGVIHIHDLIKEGIF